MVTKKKTTKKESNDNVEVCPSGRTSTIRKSIRRTLSTAQFETIVIEDSIEETITWNSLEERQTKEDNWTTVLITQFKQTHDKVLEELNLSEKKASFGKVARDSADRYTSQRAKANKPELDSLDALDTLG